MRKLPVHETAFLFGFDIFFLNVERKMLKFRKIRRSVT